MKVVCVQCTKRYEPAESRAEYRGLCSMACQHVMAKEAGAKNRRDRNAWFEFLRLLSEKRRSTEGADRTNLT